VLDTYFKQFFWTFNLAALAMCGYLVARAGNVFVADALLGEPTAVASGGRAKVEVDTNKSTVPTSAFLDRNLFGAEREDIVPEPEVDAAPERTTAPGEVDLDNCDKSSLRANLVATVVSSDDTRSVAVFVDPSKNRPESYRVGDPLLDSAEILAVQWRRVLVSNNGSCEFFSIDDDAPKKRKGRGEVAMSPPPPKKGGAPKMELGKGVKKINDTEYEIPRDEIDNVLGNLNVVATQARIVPSFRNGKANGFKLFSIRPGSLYSKIGIQNGDVIQKINGYEMNSPDKALEIYSKLKDAGNITVDLVRRGRAKTMSYNIR